MHGFALFLINSILLGVGLAMDAFSVSVANAMAEPSMSWKRKATIAGTFAGFQFLMPLIGWLCVRGVQEAFRGATRFIPWIALTLLVILGIKMIVEGIRGNGDGDDEGHVLGPGELFFLGVATSIDALSVGFTLSAFNAIKAISSCLIIGIVTFIICETGLLIGKKIGLKLAGRATILGGLILIGIGIEIFLSGIM